MTKLKPGEWVGTDEKVYRPGGPQGTGGEGMSEMYRCDKCGRFGPPPAALTVAWSRPDTKSYKVVSDTHVLGWSIPHEGRTIDLCEDCAPEVLTLMESIAAERGEDDRGRTADEV